MLASPTAAAAVVPVVYMYVQMFCIELYYYCAKGPTRHNKTTENFIDGGSTFDAAMEGRRQGSDGNISTRETAAATQTFIKRLAGLYIFCLNLHLMANCDAAPTKS